MKIYVTTLGLAILAVFAFTVAVFTLDHHVTEEATPAAAAPTTPTMAAAAGGSNTHSYAGQAPANAAELAAAHTPYPAALPPLTPGPVVDVHIELKDVTLDVAPGVHFNGWTFSGGAPGPENVQPLKWTRSE